MVPMPVAEMVDAIVHVQLHLYARRHCLAALSPPWLLENAGGRRYAISCVLARHVGAVCCRTWFSSPCRVGASTRACRGVGTNFEGRTGGQ